MSTTAQPNWHSALCYFPLKHGAKTPANTGWQQQATNDARQIAEWDRLRRDKGIACGNESDLFVIDEDKLGALAKLEAIVGKSLPRTHIVHTSKDKDTGFQKRHHYFKFPKTNTPLGNETGLFGGIDIRSTGGYVVGAGARHITDHDYEAQDDLDPIELPLEFLHALEVEKRARTRSNTTQTPDSPEKIGKGTRNDDLFKLACSLRHKVDKEAVEAAVEVYNRKHCDPPLPVSEIKALVASAFSYSKDEAPKRKLFLATKTIADEPDKILKWIWHNVILAAALNLFIGLPGEGKTLVCIFVIAVMTTGRRFPTSQRIAEPGTALIICKEDDYKLMWTPRLIAAGADLSKIKVVHGLRVEDSDDLFPWFMDEQEHLKALGETLKSDPDIKLCVIDPLADMLAHSNMNDATDVRKVMAPLDKIAKETGVAIIVNTHSTKALVDSAIKAAGGSIQISAAVPISWLFAADPDMKGRSLMLQGRNKFGKKRTFKYRIERAEWPAECARDLQDGEDDDGVPVIKFLGEADLSADEFLQRKLDKNESAVAKMRRHILDLLQPGVPRPQELCWKALRAFDHRDYIINNALEDLRVARDKKTWCLPVAAAPTPTTKQMEIVEDAIEENCK